VVGRALPVEGDSGGVPRLSEYALASPWITRLVSPAMPTGDAAGVVVLVAVDRAQPADHRLQRGRKTSWASTVLAH
jgi:hypothetical protein